MREVGPLPLLTQREEMALAKRIACHAGALREELLRIPFTARFLVERWSELRRANRVTATLSAAPAGKREPDASARIDRTMRRVRTLLARRGRLADWRDGRPALAIARIDTEIQELLLEADLAPALLGEVLAALREREAALAPQRRGPARRRSRADLAREIGLPIRIVRERMREIEGHVQAFQEARNRFAQHNLKLVVKIAKDFSGLGVPLTDLIQEGNLGLLHAIDKFDHRRGFKFSTYGYWWIQQACIRAIQKQSRLIRLPSHVYEQVLRVGKIRAEFSSHLGRAPDMGELSAQLHVSEDQLQKLLVAHQKPVSLEAPLSGSDATNLGDVIADSADTDPCDGIDRDRIARGLADLFVVLSVRERQVLRWHFGLGGKRTHTLAEIGRRLKLSRERARQIKCEALAKLQRRIEERQLFDTGCAEEGH